jgi:Gametolysin peptidase M11
MLRRMSRAVAIVLVCGACLGGAASAAVAPDPRAQDAVGDLRVLVIRATWGPRPAGGGDLSGAAAFYNRASFGRLRLKLDITPWLQAYEEPVCPSGSGPRSVFGAVGELAQDAAAAAGYDVGAYGRIAYFLPDQTCNAVGMGVGREVFIATEGGLLDDQVFVHELGHTFGLPHATSSTCARGCRIVEYGDPLSPMGGGSADFSALEKLKLGWISAVQRVERAGTYEVANIDEPSSSPQALVVPTAAGEYWIEHRAADPARVIVRLVKPNDPIHPVYLRSIFLGQPQERYVARRLLSVTREFQFRWLDRKRPSMPRARALDHAWLSWGRSLDAGSGVAAYRVSLDGKLLSTTTDLGTALPALPEGGHRVTVVAIDRAGNRSLPGVVSLHG